MNNENNKYEALVNIIKPFIPATIVMKAIAFRDIKARERTINNVYSKVIDSFLNANPKYKNKSLDSVKDWLCDIISHRVLVE